MKDRDYGFIQIPVPPVLAQLGGKTRAYRMSGPDGALCRVFVGIEPVGPLTDRHTRWHLSICGPKRLATWAELNAARDRFIPEDVFMAIPMPPKAYWLNVHPHVLHIWEHQDWPLIDQAKHEATEAWREGSNRPYSTGG